MKDKTIDNGLDKTTDIDLDEITAMLVNLSPPYIIPRHIVDSTILRLVAELRDEREVCRELGVEAIGCLHLANSQLRDIGRICHERDEARARVAELEVDVEDRKAGLDSAIKKMLAAQYKYNTESGRLQDALLDNEDLQRRVRELEAALEGIVPRCHQCDGVAIWEWSDNDGSETVCDKHKTTHFYAHGPDEIDGAMQAKRALCNDHK